jgi:hypothetical protein
VSEVNSDGLNDQKQEPSRVFAHPDHEIKLAAAKGASSKNIVEGKRACKPAAFHFERIYWDLNDEQFSAYHMAFVAGTTHQPRVHSKDLPPPPKSIKELAKHPYGKELYQAALTEWNNLQNQETFKKCPVTGISLYILPLMWVFTYKLDEDGFLVSFKARLVVRGDLQVSQFKDTYAATLAARVFRALMAIIAYFNLDIY